MTRVRTKAEPVADSVHVGKATLQANGSLSSLFPTSEKKRPLSDTGAPKGFLGKQRMSFLVRITFPWLILNTVIQLMIGTRTRNRYFNARAGESKV